MQTRLTEKGAKLLGDAAGMIQGCFDWISTDEGVHFWSRVVKLLKDKAANRTSDGKPYIEPEPPIPEGYRKANADEYKRKDVQCWDVYSKKWRPRMIQGTKFDPPEFSTRYIVPIDPPLTDEDACVWPRLSVMVRDNDAERWEGPFQYVGKLDEVPFPFVVYREDGLPCVWKQARRATAEEIEAANGNS